jgi:hypothetical protein
MLNLDRTPLSHSGKVAIMRLLCKTVTLMHWRTAVMQTSLAVIQRTAVARETPG